jgi:pyochelin biosynthetic protein PchC
MIAVESRWLRRYHEGADTRPTLVCFPHAGGAATFFFPLSQLLSADVNVLAVQYPGRQARRTEPCLTRIEDLADQVREVLAPYGSVALFGHSMGAIAAFEVARRMRDEGVETTRLLVSGRSAPSRQVRTDLHTWDDDRIIAELRKLSGTDSRLLGDEEMMREALPVLRADYTAIESYRCPADAGLSCPVSVLLGDSDERVPVESALAWRDHTTGGFDSQVYPGGHFYLAEHRVSVSSRIRTLLRGDAG